MPEDYDNSKTLPKDLDSDYSLPGRFEEGNSAYFPTRPIQPRSTNRAIILAAIAFVIVSSGFFSYYFMNQNEIDSKIIQNAIKVDPERNLIDQYGIGEYGSEHAHAAIAVFIDGEQVNFGLHQFQLTSKYIHFENNNPYMVHKHATGVPLDMLFTSVGIKITPSCIILNDDRPSYEGRFCTGEEKSLVFYVNGDRYYSDISQYVFGHNDRILVYFGDLEPVPKYLAYLESLHIFDIPKKTPQYSEEEVFI